MVLFIIQVTGLDELLLSNLISELIIFKLLITCQMIMVIWLEPTIVSCVLVRISSRCSNVLHLDLIVVILLIFRTSCSTTIQTLARIIWRKLVILHVVASHAILQYIEGIGFLNINLNLIISKKTYE